MIQVSHLTKYYGDFLAVNDLSFEIGAGHVYGFLGPNGAGKSTTMNMMTGCLSPSAGTIRIGGYDILESPEQAKRLTMKRRTATRTGRLRWPYRSIPETTGISSGSRQATSSMRRITRTRRARTLIWQ